MTTKVITRPLNTSDITVMSNITSIQVRGNKITKIGAIRSQGVDNLASIYIDLDVNHYQQVLPSILTSTEELGLVLNTEDALELGLLLVAMGLENKSNGEVSERLDQLSKLIVEIR